MQKNRRGLLISLILLAAMAGGMMFLAFADIPVPKAPVEKLLPHERFFK